MKIDLGRWTQEGLEERIRESSEMTDAGKRIGSISELFLDTPYGGSSLIGNLNQDEEFVINLAKVDCFTLIEYVEAMRRSSTFNEFQDNLKRVRYRDGEVSFNSRNHFFTDWRETGADYFEDRTREAGGDRTIRIFKRLNDREDGTVFIQGIQPVQRELRYVPASAIDETLMSRLKTGDYAGVYSEKPGLDVSHTGIIIRDGDAVSFRHASSLPIHRKVIDQDFREYFSDKPGLVVLRPRD